jgi:Protein of unknown function (DUF3383)
MATIDEIVSVTISADSKTVSRAGFGLPYLLSYHSRFAETHRFYSSLAEMTSDGFSSADSAYKMAASVFSQDPTVERVMVGRLPAAPSFTTALTITSAVEGQKVQFKIVQPVTGTVTQIDYTILAAATTTTVATAIELLVEAVTGVDSTSSGPVVTATPTVAGHPIWVYDLVNVTAQETTADAGYDDELSAQEIVDDTFYWILTDSESQANIEAVAAWALARKKIYVASTSAANELAGTGTIGATLKAAGNSRTVLLWAPNPQEFAAAAWVGNGAPKTPGSITWAFKTLLGVTAKTLTSTQQGNLTTDNINNYQTIAGIAVTRPGIVENGRWIDEIHGIDALEADIKESVFSLLANSDKVPFTQSGFDLIANAILGALKRFEGSIEQPGLLAVDTSKVIMPALASVNPADKAARILRNVRFSSQLSGAIHQCLIVGTLSNA